MILHKVDLGREIGNQGVYVNRRKADAVDVSGTLYADEFSGRFLIRADGWHEDRSAALAAAADTLASWSERLAEQAERLRREAVA